MKQVKKSAILFIVVCLGLLPAVDVFASAKNNEKGALCHIEKIIGQPPAPGSMEDLMDFATLLLFQAVRTPQDCAYAASQEDVSLEAFFGGENGPLSKEEVKKHKFFFLRYMLKAGIPSTIGKLKFKRPRPYDANVNIQPCIQKEKSYAFPSGHAAVSRLVARALGAKYPERAELFMLRADEVANNRVVGGVHHPTDIVAGKALGDYYAKKFLASKQFMLELEAL
jgi:acid phosphatase (class A)